MDMEFNGKRYIARGVEECTAKLTEYCQDAGIELAYSVL